VNVIDRVRPSSTLKLSVLKTITSASTLPLFTFFNRTFTSRGQSIWATFLHCNLALSDKLVSRAALLRGALEV